MNYARTAALAAVLTVAGVLAAGALILSGLVGILEEE